MLAVSHPWQQAGSFSKISWQLSKDQDTQLPSYSSYPNYPINQIQLPNSLNLALTLKTRIPSSRHKTHLPLILDPFYASSSLLSYPRTFLEPVSPRRRLSGRGRGGISPIFDPQFLPAAASRQSQLLLRWLLKAFARASSTSSRWGSDGIPTKLGITIILIFIRSKFSPTFCDHILLQIACLKSD